MQEAVDVLPGLDQRRLVARSASAEAQDGFLGAALGNLAGRPGLGLEHRQPAARGEQDEAGLAVPDVRACQGRGVVGGGLPSREGG